jgi:hypothetical protein
MTELFGAGQNIPNKMLSVALQHTGFSFHGAELFIQVTELCQHAAVPLEI